MNYFLGDILEIIAELFAYTIIDKLKESVPLFLKNEKMMFTKAL